MVTVCVDSAQGDPYRISGREIRSTSGPYKYKTGNASGLERKVLNSLTSPLLHLGSSGIMSDSAVQVYQFMYAVCFNMMSTSSADFMSKSDRHVLLSCCVWWVSFLNVCASFSQADTSLVILCYDIIITLDVEAKHVWKTKLSLAKVVYLMNRYMALAAIIFGHPTDFMSGPLLVWLISPYILTFCLNILQR